MEGYKLMFNDTLVTVWSAPNYCYRCGNVAAILEMDEHLNKNFKIFEAAPQVTKLESKLTSSRRQEEFLQNNQHQIISCKFIGIQLIILFVKQTKCIYINLVCEW